MWVQGQGHQEGMAKYPGAMPHKPEEGEGGMVTRIWRAAAISKGLMIEASMENSAAPNPSLAGVCEVSAPISLCFCLSFFIFFFFFCFCLSISCFCLPLIKPSQKSKSKRISWYWEQTAQLLPWDNSWVGKGGQNIWTGKYSAYLLF